MTLIPECWSGVCAEIPPEGFVIRFFRGIPKSCRSPRYWWLVLRPEEIEVCLKAPSTSSLRLILILLRRSGSATADCKPR
jgi:hypothetical protein